MSRRPLFGDTVPAPPPQEERTRAGCRANACSGGRRPCPSPQLCQRSKRAHDDEQRSVLWRLFEVFVFALCALALWHAWATLAQRAAT